MIKIKRIFTILIALLIAFIVSYYYSKSEKFLLPLTTFIVMQTPVSFAIRLGLLRYLFIIIVVIFLTLLLLLIYPATSFSILYERLYDISMGAIIGIICNFLIFPIRPEVQFRKTIIPILEGYADYLMSILDLILKKPQAVIIASQMKQNVEKILLKYSPTWVYKKGFNINFREGHRHFLVMIDRIEQVLFSMHHIARHNFAEDFINNFDDLLLAYFKNAKEIMLALVKVLSLTKLSEGMSDLNEEILNIENAFYAIAPHTLELLDISKDYIFFAMLIEDLKDLRYVLIRLASALRSEGTPRS